MFIKKYKWYLTAQSITNDYHDKKVAHIILLYHYSIGHIQNGGCLYVLVNID